MQLGNIAPFRRSPEVRDPESAVVQGTVPAWLRGTLVRTCPAVFEQGSWHARHWFDGLGQIYAFRIGTSSVSFQSRLLESEAAQQIAEGRSRLSTFGTPTGRTPWQRLVQPVQRSTDNTNVNLLPIAGQWIALTEGERQLRIDPSSLRSLGAVPYEQDEITGTIMGAHPQFDTGRRRVVNLATRFGRQGVVSIFEHEPGAQRRRVVGSWRTERVPYLHAFGLTPAHAVMVGHPFSVRPMDMLWSNRGFIDHFEWRPQDGTRMLVMDLATGATTTYEADPMFVFHTVNAFERDGETILDALAYPDAGIMSALRTERMLERLPDLRPRLTRFVMRPGRPRALVETLSETGFEFPRTNEHWASGRAYRYAWGASNGPRPDGGYGSSVVKIDLHTGLAQTFSDGERIYGEPVFVGRPGSDDEDDGVLLSVGVHEHADESALAILDARSMALLSSVEVPGAIPLGFHGSFIPER